MSDKDTPAVNGDPELPNSEPTSPPDAGTNVPVSPDAAAFEDLLADEFPLETLSEETFGRLKIDDYKPFAEPFGRPGDLAFTLTQAQVLRICATTECAVHKSGWMRLVELVITEHELRARSFNGDAFASHTTLFLTKASGFSQNSLSASSSSSAIC